MNDNDLNSDLAGQVAGLQRQIFLLLLALIVVTATLAGYLWFQSHEINKNVNATRVQIIQPFYTKKLPAIKTLMGELTSYGNAHPQYRFLLVKYGFETNATPAAR